MFLGNDARVINYVGEISGQRMMIPHRFHVAWCGHWYKITCSIPHRTGKFFLFRFGRIGRFAIPYKRMKSILHCIVGAAWKKFGDFTPPFSIVLQHGTQVVNNHKLLDARSPTARCIETGHAYMQSQSCLRTYVLTYSHIRVAI